MSLRNLDLPIVNGEGTEMKETINGVDRAAIMRHTLRAALNSGPMLWKDHALTFIPDPALTVDEKIRMYDLSNKLRDAGPVDLKAEEILLIKKCIAHMVPFMYGQICAALEADIPPT